MLAFALALLGGIPPWSCHSADPIDRYVRDFLSRHKIPAAAIAVVRHDRIVKLAGYGRAGGPHVRFEIGSITKQFTALVVMQLVAEGKLELDAPIGRYLASLPPHWKDIRLRHLLTHTSGLPDWEEPGLLDLRRDYSPEEFIALIGARPLDFVPGARWSYTNSAYPLVGMIIEAVAGKPYEQVVQERIFRPAGMRETLFRRNGVVVPRSAAGYVDSAGVLMAGLAVRPRVLAPNGGILSTVSDLAKWSLALTHGKLVPAATFEAMATPVVLNDGSRFNAGIAWFVDRPGGHRALIHNGATAAGFSSVVYLYPEDRLFVAVLLDIDRGAAVNQLATAIAGLIEPILEPHPSPPMP